MTDWRRLSRKKNLTQCPESVDHYTTLHMHIRLGTGFHPFDQAKSFTVDHLVEKLSSGMTIDQIILERQQQTNGQFLAITKKRDDELYDDVPGITVAEHSANIHRLDRSLSETISVDSHDDLRAYQVHP